MKKFIQATSIAAQDSESEEAIETAKTSRLLAKKASNYIFYGAENAPLEKDTIDSMLDEFLTCQEILERTGFVSCIGTYVFHCWAYFFNKQKKAPCGIFHCFSLVDLELN